MQKEEIRVTGRGYRARGGEVILDGAAGLYTSSLFAAAPEHSGEGGCDEPPHGS